MPRYIDADILKKHGWVLAKIKTDKKGVVTKIMSMQIEDAPTADVVPKSEVELLEREVRLLTENSITVKYPHCVIGSYYAVLTKSLEDYEKVIADISSAAKAEVAGEIFEEVGKILYKHTNIAIKEKSVTCELAIDYIGEDIAELKKKYTEENV